MNLCRLCGEEKSPLDFIVELSDKTNWNWTYRDLIEHHTRVSLKTNKLLPQSICEECRVYVDGFAEFSSRLQAVQNSFDSKDDSLDPSIAKECAELIPEIILKEQNFSEKEFNSSDSENETSHLNNESKSKSSSQYGESLSYEEVFASELNERNNSLVLHLDVPAANYNEEAITDSALAHLDQTRWSNLVKNCEICDEPIKSLIDFNSHQESNHNTKTVQVPCTLCSSSFKKIYIYINHILNKHLHLEHLRYCCLICNAMFYSLVPLYNHVRNRHSTELGRIFQCLICGHHSENLALLKKHKRVHDDDEENDEITRMYSVLKSGQKRTLDIDDCYKNDDGTVSSERQEFFMKWTSFKINCYRCSKEEMSPIEYFLHHQNEHIDWTDPSKNLVAFRFSCNECPKESFASLTTFFSHQVYKHLHDELSFRCLVCSKMFWNYVALSHHLKSYHPSFRQYLCMICGRMLDRLSLFRHHLTAAHGSNERGEKEKKSKNDVKRKTKPNELQKSKRSKSEKLIVKEESVSEFETEESQSEIDDEFSSEEVELKYKPLKKLRKSHERKHDQPKQRRPNNRHRPEKQMLYGPELNTPEKLFAEEISGTSIFSMSIHLNISSQENLINGEVPEELAHSQGLSPLRWKDMLICAVCKLNFDNINSLTDHIDKNHGRRTRAFGCFNCDIGYGALYESSLVNHLVERHYYEHLKFCCLVCSKLFYDFLSLVNHYKMHGGDFEILVCFICGFYAKTLDDLKEHKAYHAQMENSKPDNQMLCERVLEKFSQGAELNTINTEVASYERNLDGSVTMDCQRRFMVDWSFAQYQCPLCFTNHSNPFELFAHLRLKHPKEQEQTRRIYSCNTCIEKKVFSGMHYFINHAAECHVPSLRFTCVVCSRLFWNYLALANHYKNIHPTFTAVFCCHCGKLFHSITSGAIHYKKIMIMLTEEEKQLKKEGKLETEESSHICHVCGKCCKNNYTLVKHITTHEEPDPSKMLQCHVCSKLFNSKNKLNQHMVGHNNLRKWKCKTCGMSFNFKKLLQMHTRAVHENERSFACTFCEKRFFKKYDLTVHVRLHTGDFPYACPVTECDAKYPAWSNLFKHCQSRHKLDIRSEGYKKLRASEKTTQNDDYGSD